MRKHKLLSGRFRVLVPNRANYFGRDDMLLSYLVMYPIDQKDQMPVPLHTPGRASVAHLRIVLFLGLLLGTFDPTLFKRLLYSIGPLRYHTYLFLYQILDRYFSDPSEL